MEYIHPWFENATEEELKALFDEIEASFPDMRLEEIIHED